jgi:hypothetical protein
MKKRWRSLPPTRTGAAPFRYVGGATPIVVTCHGSWGYVGDWENKLEVGEDLKAKGLVKSWGHLRFYL